MDVQDQLIAQVIEHHNIDSSSDGTLSRDEATEVVISPLHIFKRNRSPPQCRAQT